MELAMACVIGLYPLRADNGVRARVVIIILSRRHRHRRRNVRLPPSTPLLVQARPPRSRDDLRLRDAG